MTVAELQLACHASDSHALCEGGGRREREGKDENYPASLQSFVERRGGGEEGWSEALPVEDKETGRGLKHSFESRFSSKSSCNCFQWKSV